MKPIETLLTHPGGAHKDEFLACCVVLALHPVPIERREPKEEDLHDPFVCILDVGGNHVPDLHNFDHHQFPKDHPPTCSLSLILQHLGLYEDAREFCEWLEPAEWFDCRGPISTANWLGIDRDVLNQLNSPIDVTLIRRFAQSRRLLPGEPLWEIMRMVGQDLLDYLKNLRSRMNFIQQHSIVWDIPLADGPAKVLFMPRTDPLPDEPSTGLERYIEAQGLENEIAATVYPDRRGSGYGLSRYRDNQRVDFTRLAACEDVHFFHARGFVAKTNALSEERLQELLFIASGA
jgi:hypothetical protein